MAHPPTRPVNPANAPAKRVTEASRIPLSVPQLKLEVPDIPGYHLHWFLGENVERAQRAGYEFVQDDEVDVVNRNVADDAANSGSTDMGTRISTFAGGLVEGTAEPQRLYLMKLRQEWRDADVKKLEEVNERIAQALRGGEDAGGGTGTAPTQTAADRQRRYMKAGQDLFYPKTRKV